MRNELLYLFDRKSSMMYMGRHSLFSTIYEQIILLQHIRESFLCGYMLNYISFEWDEIEVQ